jgi:hypothetical protein
MGTGGRARMTKMAQMTWAIPVMATGALFASGCNRGVDARAAAAMAQYGMKTVDVYPLAGKVLIDGAPPGEQTQKGRGSAVFIVLFDQANPGARANEMPHAIVQADGSFAFRTYSSKDGVPPGKYVVAIAELERGGRASYGGPDGLNNLYNDPDKNAQNRELVIDHHRPGKTDYYFNLRIAGEEPVQPGPRAVTGIRNY